MSHVFLGPVEIVKHNFWVGLVDLHPCAHVTAALRVRALTLLVFIPISLLALLEKSKQRTVESLDLSLVRLLSTLLVAFRTYIKDFSAEDIFHEVIFIQVRRSLMVAV